jgi:hypothetical protein
VACFDDTKFNYKVVVKVGHRQTPYKPPQETVVGCFEIVIPAKRTKPSSAHYGA